MFTLIHLILAAGIAFVLGSVAVAVYHGKSLKDAIAAEIATLKSDISTLKDRLDPSAAAPNPPASSTTQPIKATSSGPV